MTGSGAPAELDAPPPPPTPVRAGEERLPHPLDPDGLPAWLAEPSDRDRIPGVVVIHDGTGLDAPLRALCGRLAATGLLVVAPDLAARAGAEPADPEAIVDIDAAITHLRSHERCNGRVGAIGIGTGGRLALILATSPSAPDRVVDVRGSRMARRTALIDGRHPQVAVERVDWLRSPLLGVFSQADDDPDERDVAELESALAERGIEHRIVTLEEEAADIFNAPIGAPPDPDVPSAWSESMRWLEPLR